MASNQTAQLEQAYDLIQADRHDEALFIVRRVLASEATNSPEDNANAYWLMANAVDDPSAARKALINVLKHDPSHVMASETLDELNDQFPPKDEELTMLLELDRTGDFDLADLSAPLSDDELADLFAEDGDIDLSAFDNEEDPFAALSVGAAEEENKKGRRSRQRAPRDRQAARESRGRRSILRPLLLVVLIGVIALVAFAVLSSGGSSESDTGQEDLAQLVQLDNAPDDSSALVSSIATDAQQTIGNNAAAFVVENEDGTQTIYVQTCICTRRDCTGTPSGELFAVIAEGFLTIAERSSVQPVEQITTAGVDVNVCASDDTVYRVTTPISNATEYLNDNDLDKFRGTWTIIES